MSASRDDFGIAFRSALLQKGAAQKFSLISLIFLASLIFFLDVYNFKLINQIRSIINDGIFRISVVASAPSKFVPSLSNEISSLIDIKDENERLKKELETLKFKELNIEYLANQNKILQQFIESDEEIYRPKKNIIIAKVLLDKSSPYLKSIIINRGSKAGVLKGMPVLAKNYLVGRVVETNYLSSRVLLLNDLNSRVPVTLNIDGTQAILQGDGGNSLTLKYLPEDYEVAEGVSVFTSGKDRIFSPGTPIGITDKKGEVKLYMDPNQLSFIKIDLSKNKKEPF